jgi:hypothetical protein
MTDGRFGRLIIAVPQKYGMADWPVSLLLLWLLLLIALNKAAALVSRVLLRIQNMMYGCWTDGKCTSSPAVSRRKPPSLLRDHWAIARGAWEGGLCRLAPLLAHAPIPAWPPPPHPPASTVPKFEEAGRSSGYVVADD